MVLIHWQCLIYNPIFSSPKVLRLSMDGWSCGSDA